MKYFLALIAIAVVLSYAVQVIFPAWVNPPSSEATEMSACTMAQKFVTDQLKAPSTAEYAPCHEPATVVTRVERIWKVQSYVDAQNGFGALLRNAYTVEMIYYPSTDKWTLVDLAISAR